MPQLSSSNAALKQQNLSFPASCGGPTPSAALIVVFGDSDEECRIHLWCQQVRTVLCIRRQSTAMERTAGTDAIRNRRSQPQRVGTGLQYPIVPILRLVSTKGSNRLIEIRFDPFLLLLYSCTSIPDFRLATRHQGCDRETRGTRQARSRRYASRSRYENGRTVSPSIPICKLIRAVTEHRPPLPGACRRP